MTSHDVCSICLENIGRNIIKLECGHLFCTGCFLQYFDRSLKIGSTSNAVVSCPNCRKQIYESRYSFDVESRGHHVIVVQEPIAQDGETEERANENRVLVLNVMAVMSLLLFLWALYLQEMRLEGG